MKSKLFYSLIFLLVFSCCLSFACCESSKSIDFDNLSSLTDEELLLYDNLIQAEKTKRGLLVSLSDGEYIVGRDIAEGHYKITFFPNANIEKYKFSLNVRIYTNKKDMDEYESGKGSSACIVKWENFYDAGEYQFYLEEGQVLFVAGAQENGSTHIEKSKGLFMD